MRRGRVSVACNSRSGERTRRRVRRLTPRQPRGRATAPVSTRGGARGFGCEAQPNARAGACAPHSKKLRCARATGPHLEGAPVGREVPGEEVRLSSKYSALAPGCRKSPLPNPLSFRRSEGVIARRCIKMYMTTGSGGQLLRWQCSRCENSARVQRAERAGARTCRWTWPDGSQREPFHPAILFAKINFRMKPRAPLTRPAATLSPSDGERDG